MIKNMAKISRNLLFKTTDKRFPIKSHFLTFNEQLMFKSCDTQTVQFELLNTTVTLKPFF